jgi:hypothetical protein
MTDNVSMVAVDGRDALAYVLVRPGQTKGSVSIEASAKGLSKLNAATVLRQVADSWAPAEEQAAADAENPATWLGGHALVVEYGDCELYGRCQCGERFGMVTPDNPIDSFARPWEQHVMGLGR